MATVAKINELHAFLFVTRQKLKTGKVSRKSIFFYFQTIMEGVSWLQRMTLKKHLFVLTTVYLMTNFVCFANLFVVVLWFFTMM